MLAHEVRQAYQLVTGPTVEPVSLAEFKRQRRIDGNDEDADFSRRIGSARKAVEEITSRQLCTATWKLYLDRFPCWIELRKCPVQSVTSITYVDGDGVTQAISTDDYRVDVVSEPARITPAFGVAWPTTQAVVNAVCVTFVAGYGDEANDIDAHAREAVMLIAAMSDEQREKPMEWTPAALALIDLLRYDY